jgi:hypothetical protein
VKIGLIDVDGHNFPNLALMRISSYHKQHGDTVEWWWSDFVHYDIVYMSKIFSDAYTKDVEEPFNADKVIKGGTGYCITLGPDGKEHFDQSKNFNLPVDVERCFPDYSIYPQFDFAVRDMGYDPYVMIYDKPHAPKEIRRLQRWCNNKIIFKSCPKFEDYNP